MARALVVCSLACTLALGCHSDPSGTEDTGRAGDELSAQVVADYYVVLEGPPAAQMTNATSPAEWAAASRVTRGRVAEIEAQQSALAPLVESAGATIVARFTRIGNALQVRADGSALARIERLPGVLRVERVPLVEPFLGSALPVIGAPAVWAKSTPLQGDGIRIGIVDSGIDYTHADFGGPGTSAAYLANDPDQIEPGTFPTARVVGGWDFVGDDYDPTSGKATPLPDPDPLDCTKPESNQVSGGHGTHVAGIAAGNGVSKDGTAFTGAYEQSFVPSAFKVAPGVAPRAKLWALKIFGCDGSTTALASALERAADPNADGVFDDRLDVVNASLGTSYALGSTFNAELVENLTKVGSLLVAAAGNDGQSFYAAAAPGVLPQVLAVAASADNQLIALDVTAPASALGSYPAAEGAFTKPLAQSGPVSGAIVLGQPQLGCSAFSNAGALAGKTVLVDRGQCPFVKKFNNAIAAGASAVVVVDDTDDALPFSMGGGDPGTVSIPGVMISKADGAKLKGALAKEVVTVALDATKLYTGAGSEMLAGFSSRGPSADDERLKPEIAAPGFSIDSARVGSGSEPRRSQGTSMASPVVAGAAALMRQARPDFLPLEVKAALVNSAESLSDMSGARYATSSVGAGRLAIDRAVGVTVTAAADLAKGDVGVSFGSLVVDQPTSVKRSFVVENHGQTQQAVALSVDPSFELAGVTVSVSPETLSLGAGEKASVELTLSLDPAALGSPGPDPATEAIQYETARQYMNEASGVVKLSLGSESLVVPYQGSVRAGAQRKVTITSLCGGADSGEVSLPIGGTSAHPKPVVTAFQLGLIDGPMDGADTNPNLALIDILAMGAATDLATVPFEEASVFFGVAIAGEWSSPARGSVSVVSIEIDADQIGGADYELRTEALTKDGPYADVLVATTYVKGDPQPIARRLINMATAEDAATQPFHNSVIVLVANLKDIGVSAENPVFDYVAVSESPYFDKGQRTDWVTFDAKKPLIDPSNNADGRPLYQGSEPVLLKVDPAARAAGSPLEVLLLHHTNVAGARYEVVDLAALSLADQNLALAATAPAELKDGTLGEIVLTATNSGSKSIADVEIDGTIQGGMVASAAPSAGSCSAGASLDCKLGAIEPGKSVEVKLSVRAASASESVELTANAGSGLECESSLADNVAKAAMTVIGPEPRPELEAHGGCGCRVGHGRASHAVLSLAALLALALRRRRSR